MKAYASLCGCGHLSSHHGLDPDAESVLGPYWCQDCGCSIYQDTPQTPLTRREYEALPAEVRGEQQ